MSDFSLHAFAPTAAAQKKAVAIGFFDGVHRGHRFVFDELCRRAQAMGESPWAVTFDVHPFAVIAPERQPLLLTTLDEKIEALRSCGLGGAVVLHFDRKWPISPLSTLCATCSTKPWTSNAFSSGTITDSAVLCRAMDSSDI